MCDGPAFPAGPFAAMDRVAQLFAASVIAAETSSGDIVPAKRPWMASLMAAPRAGVVAWSR